MNLTNDLYKNLYIVGKTYNNAAFGCYIDPNNSKKCSLERHKISKNYVKSPLSMYIRNWSLISSTNCISPHVFWITSYEVSNLKINSLETSRLYCLHLYETFISRRFNETYFLDHLHFINHRHKTHQTVFNKILSASGLRNNKDIFAALFVNLPFRYLPYGIRSGSLSA